MLDFMERLDIYELDIISSRYKARIQECITCGDIPDEGVFINDILYCESCAKEYVIDHYSMDELRNYFDTELDENTTEDELIHWVRSMSLSELCDMFAGFGFEHWEY